MSMLSTAFDRFEHATLVKAGETVSTVPVEGGWLDAVDLVADETVALSLSEEERERLQTVREGRRFLYAPVAAGESCGALVYRLDGVELARVGLTTAQDSEQLAETPSLWARLFGWLPFL